MRGERMRRELEDAAREGPGSTGSEDRTSIGSFDLNVASPSSPSFYNGDIPTKVSVRFVSL